MEWIFAQHDPAEKLAQLHFYSVVKKQGDQEIEFRITVKEFVPAKDNRMMAFFAETDKQTNQKTMPYTPSGWGETLLKALSECVRAIHRFPYEGPDVS